MGNDLEKQYNIKTKPLKLPGSYNFLRFVNHPSKPISLLVVKQPHKVAIIQSNVLLPIQQIKNSSTSDSSIAVCPRSIPLGLVKPKGQTEMKILMYKILKTRSEIGRCFLCKGRILLWCQQKRGISSMAPQELQHGKIDEKSKVFTAGITLLNFLSCVYENQKSSGKKKTKQSKKSNLNASISAKFTENSQQSEDTNTQIKLFFDPKDEKEYKAILNTLESKLSITSFWSSISQGLRQLVMNMLSTDPTQRIDLSTILEIPYFQNCQQLKLYFILADQIGTLQRKQALIFMKSLELIVKQGTIFSNQTLDDYIMPVLEDIAVEKQGDNKSLNLSAQALSILIELNKPPIDMIYKSLKLGTAADRNMIALALQKRQKLFHLLPTQKYDSAMSRMAFFSYEIKCQQLLLLGIRATPQLMDWIKQQKYKKQIQCKLVQIITERTAHSVEKTEKNQNILLEGLKCVIYLLNQQSFASIHKISEISLNPLTQTDLQINIHYLHICSLLINHIPCSELMTAIFPKIQPYLSKIDISNQLFLQANNVLKKSTLKLFKNRKLDSQNEIEMEYADNYFKFKTQKQKVSHDANGQVISQYQKERARLKSIVQKNQMKKLQWIFRDIL